MKDYAILLIMAIVGFNACTKAPKIKAVDTVTKEPTVNDYKVGEQWTWKWKRTTEGKNMGEGEDFQEVVKFKNSLGFSGDGTDTTLIANKIIANRGASYLRWPLKVGKKWVFDEDWESNDGTKGHTKQEAEVVSFEEITVDAGKFMAYKILLKGRVTNSRGFKGEMTDTWWYAPELKTYIKHVNEDGSGVYVNELINYTSAQ